MRKSLLAYPALERPASAAEIDRVFKALADPSRRELLDRLHARAVDVWVGGGGDAGQVEMAAEGAVHRLG